MTPDDHIRIHLRERLNEVLGSEAAAELMESLPPIRWSDLATKQDLDRFATKQDLDRFVTKQDLDELPTKLGLDRFATKQDLDRFATKQDLDELPTKLRLDRFATKQDVDRFATREWVSEGFQHIERVFDLRFEAMGYRMDSFEHRIDDGLAMVRTEIQQMGSDLRTTIAEQIRDQTLRLVAVFIPAIFSGVGLAFAVAKLA